MNFNDIDWTTLLTRIGIVVVIIIVTWILAKLVKTGITKLVNRIPAVRNREADGETLGSSVGTIGSLLVWLFGLVAVLNVFDLQGVLQPITNMLATLLAYLPNIIGAGLVFFIGLLIARIARQLVVTALGSVDLGRFLREGKRRAEAAVGTGGVTPQAPAPDPATGARIASAIGALVYGLIVILVAIAALDILAIDAISGPATQMLASIFDALPNILGSLLLLAIGVFIAKFVGELVGQVLGGFGVDRPLREANVLPGDKSVVATIVWIVRIAIVLFFAVMAAQNFPAIQIMLSEILALAGRVVFGAVIIAAGFYIAGLLARMVAGTAGQVMRYATIALFVAMGLSYMGLADSIVHLAFGSVVVGGALAAALAFGLGGRDAAARLLERVDADRPDVPTTPPGTLD